MKILITGATGFIGNHLINYILKNKFDVQIIATSSSQQKAKLFPWYNKVIYKSLDINSDLNKSNLTNYFINPDYLIHLAWQGLPNYKEMHHLENNLKTNYLFLKNLITNGLKNISIIGTCLEYGLLNGCLNEEINTVPVTPYGLAKDSLRKFIVQLDNTFQYNLNLKWIRLFYIYGKGKGPSSILSVIDHAIKNNEKGFNMSKGDQVRDYLPVEDASKYIYKISTQTKINGIINCCSGNPITLKDFISQYLKEKKSDLQLNLGYYPYLDYEPFEFWGDTSKLIKILNE